MQQKILILDFGGQYNMLIARRVRELGVYCELLPSEMKIEQIRQFNPIGIILTGGPNSVYRKESPKIDPELFNLGVPVLGICYGCQLTAYLLGGGVQSADVSEYGKAEVTFLPSPLTKGLPQTDVCWMSHTDRIVTLPAGFKKLAYSQNCPVAAMGNDARKIYGVQFHPEVHHTRNGIQILKNFLFDICGAAGDWTMSNFVNRQTEQLRARIGDKKVLCALSGGVDSAVAATLVHRAIGDRLTCVFVDHGLLRKFEADDVMSVFGRDMGFNLIKVDAAERFLQCLKGVTDPEQKRKIIGEEFIRTFEAESKRIGKVNFLVQGTIYSDVIESGTGKSAVIKTHHNVGGLPSVIDFEEIIEPLRNLFKDEVRQVGLELGLPKSVVMRQPFPGPGLAIRIMGEVTAEKLKIVRESDYILREEIERAGLNRDIWQYFTVMVNSKTVGVQGDFRTYENVIAIRAVNSVDSMTADWARIPYDVLEKISCRIVNEVKHVNRIVYDVTSKPPATIEWE